VIEMEIVFWALAGLSIYSYVLFPIVLVVLLRITCRPWKKEDDEPMVSMVVSAHNEEMVIAAKIENALALDYPRAKLEIMVVSDGSTDSTEGIVRNFCSRHHRVILKGFPERFGKTECLNRVVPEAQGDIILFTDANSMFPSDILKKLVRNFADPEVGLVTGWTRYGDVNNTENTAGVYSRFEKWTKVRESQISSCVGADGAVFATRKELYQILREVDINDFVIPLNVIRQGKRVVIDPEVFCLEKPAEESEKEYRRQVRITTRTLRAIGRNYQFLNPLRYGSFAFFLLSHKVLRFLTPFFLIALFAVNLFLWTTGFIYVVALVVQIAVLLLSIGGLLRFVPGRVGNIVRMFSVTLLAQLGAWFRTFAGVSDTTWTPQR